MKLVGAVGCGFFFDVVKIGAHRESSLLGCFTERRLAEAGLVVTSDSLHLYKKP